MSQSKRNQLPAGYVLTIVANAVSAGTVQRLPSTGDSLSQYAVAEIAASTTTTLGPFATAHNYEILSTAGELTYSLAQSDSGPLTSVAAADISDASANSRSFITAADYAAMRSLLGVNPRSIAEVITANSLSAFAIDTGKAQNSKTISANQTFTFSGAPTTGTYFSLEVTNSSGSSVVVTIPSSFSKNLNAAITSFTLGGGAVALLDWFYDGATYKLDGDPVAISDLTADATPDIGADYIEEWDASAGAHKKVLLQDLVGRIPQNSKSAAYTTLLTDAGKHIFHPTADNNARTFTIDSNANVAYAIGTAITFVNEINTVTIAITSDTMTLMGAGTTGSRTLAASGIATALKVTATKWVISGTGLT